MKPTLCYILTTQIDPRLLVVEVVVQRTDQRLLMRVRCTPQPRIDDCGFYARQADRDRRRALAQCRWDISWLAATLPVGVYLPDGNKNKTKTV